MHEAVLPREVRKALGLAPAEMAERLGMDLGAYLAWGRPLGRSAQRVGLLRAAAQGFSG